jgi:hypothetical protein
MGLLLGGKPRCIGAGIRKGALGRSVKRPVVGLETEGIIVTVQPLRTRPPSNAKVAATSFPPGARAWAMARRVWLSHTLTISGGRKARPFS